MITSIVDRIVAARHDEEKGEWACFREMATGTGHSHPGRFADLFALNCYPSKGFRSIAYEVKRSRADFKKEIEDPTKRAPWEKLASECYFATPPGLVKADEVPEGWGLIEVGDAVRVVKVARQRTPEPWPMAFCAAVARRSADPSQRWASAATWKYEGKDLDVAAVDALVRERVGEIKIATAPPSPPPRDRAGEALASMARGLLGYHVTPAELRDNLQKVVVVENLRAQLKRALEALG
jgi:hypothetical protein